MNPPLRRVELSRRTGMDSLLAGNSGFFDLMTPECTVRLARGFFMLYSATVYRLENRRTLIEQCKRWQGQGTAKTSR
jgi:predicted kinase